MKAVVLFMVFNMLKLAWCYPVPERNYDSCLILTEERQKQINYIEGRLSQFLGDLENEFEDIDITNVKINVEKHTDGEPEKDSAITVTVNDCFERKNQPNLDYDEIDVDESNARALETTQQANFENENNKVENAECTDESFVSDDYQTDNQDTLCTAQIIDENNKQSYNDSETIEDCDDSAPVVINNDAQGKSPPHIKRPKSPPEVVVVELSKEELRRVEEMERKTGNNKPFVLIEYEDGTREIKFI